MKPLLREPLIHFVFLGGALFFAYGLLNSTQRGEPVSGKPRIQVTQGDMRWLAETWSRQWQREPSAEEMSGLISDYVREQMLAHEARTLGLDENDTVIRRRLAQKVEFLVRDTAMLAEPSEDELRAFYARHAARYDREARLTFRHVFFNPERRADASADARRALDTLDSTASPENTLGDPSLLGTEFLDVEEHAVRSMFGDAFASGLVEAAVGGWIGPIESVYGFHLVFLSERQEGGPSPFESVRDRVKSDWGAEQQRLAHEAYFQELLRKYDVVMDAPVRAMQRPVPAAEQRAI